MVSSRPAGLPAPVPAGAVPCEHAGHELMLAGWQQPGEGTPILALHGWLDNANSFAPLAESLPGRALCAVDGAGQGKSAWRGAGASYDLAHDLADVLALIDGLASERVVLLGHSRGATVAALVAALAPERVAALVLVEGGAPTPREPDDLVGQLARATQARRRASDRGYRIFASRDHALRERMGSFAPVTATSAEWLAQRSLVPEQDGFGWRADPRLKVPELSGYSRSELNALFRGLPMPTLLVASDEGGFAEHGTRAGLLEHIPNATRRTIPGGHHAHMEQGCAPLAAELTAFLGRLGLWAAHDRPSEVT